MPYNTKSIILDADGKPVPQYFSSGNDVYEVIKGENGNMLIKVSDTSIIQPVDMQAIYYKSQTGLDALPIYSPDAIQGNTDATANTVYGIPVVPMQTLWNDGTAKWERVRNNSYGTALAASARTATPAVQNLVNYNSKGVIVFLNVTAASGTGGLTLSVRATELVASNPVQINSSPTAVTATGTYSYVIYPSNLTGSFTQMTSSPLPYKWSINVAHGDASSYNYSVSYAYLS
jgi:hypothetical protein